MTRMWFWIAHRAGGDAAPENTLAAFRVGQSAGFRAFECDVRLSRDGAPFLLHDDRLDRTTSGHGVAKRHAWSQIAQLDAGSWFSRRYGHEPVASLDRALAFAARHRAWLNLELKAARGDAATTGAVVAREAARCWASHPRMPVPALSSFSTVALRAARKTLNAMGAPLPLALLAMRWDPRLIDRARRLDASALHLHWRAITAARIRKAHASNLRLRAFTVNDANVAGRLKAWDVDGIFTDQLDLPASVDARAHVATLHIPRP